MQKLTAPPDRDGTNKFPKQGSKIPNPMSVDSDYIEIKIKLRPRGFRGLDCSIALTVYSHPIWESLFSHFFSLVDVFVTIANWDETPKKRPLNEENLLGFQFDSARRRIILVLPAIRMCLS